MRRTSACALRSPSSTWMSRLPVAAVMSRTVVLARAESRATRYSRGPSAASAVAVSLPIPLVAPVIITTRPAIAGPAVAAIWIASRA